jgi:gliding motility-associated-like protein
LNGDTLNLSGQTGNILGWLFSTDGGTTWSPLSNTNGSQVFGGLTQETWFTAVVQNGPCAVDTSSIAIISIYPVSAVSAGADTSIMAGSSVQLNGSGAGTVFWTPAATLDNPLSFTPVATPVTGTTYIMIVTDLNGCINTDTVTVNVILPEFAGMITNLMTPNSDGINDYFYIEGIENFADNNLMIYNIYGNQVYSKEGYTNDWDGDDLPDGTYYYVLTFDSNEIVKKGSIDILRK